MIKEYLPDKQAARVDGEPREGMKLHVVLRVGDKLIAEDVYAVISGEASQRC